MLFDLGDIWNGKRQIFMRSYSQELAATNLLSRLDLSPDNIINIFTNYDIDLDVADSRGNTRLMIASVIFHLLLNVSYLTKIIFKGYRST